MPIACRSSASFVTSNPVAFANRWQDRELKVFNETHMEPANSYHIEKTMNRIIPRVYSGFDTTTYYIYNAQQYDPALFRTQVDSFMVRHSSYPNYYVGQLRTVDPKEIERLTVGGRPGF